MSVAHRAVLDLEPLTGPLRFYRVQWRDGDYVFIHRVTGEELRVCAGMAHPLYKEMQGEDDATRVEQVFEILLPDLCQACGVPAEGNMCESCRARHVDDLLRILER